MKSLTNRADYLASAILAIAGGGRFVILSKSEGKGLPIVIWRLKSQQRYDGRSHNESPL